MTSHQLAWLFLRSFGLICLLFSFWFGLHAAISFSYMASYYVSDRTYSSGDSNAHTQRDISPDAGFERNMYDIVSEMAYANALRSLFLFLSALYLLRGGGLLHKLLIFVPRDKAEQGAAANP